MALVLIGFMGAGKSRSAGRLAALRGRAPIDGDALLVERFGHSVAREFELHGERAFRVAEEEVACELLESADARDVIALGGGSVLSARVRAALAGHTTALIEVAPEVAWERVHRDDGAERPLARDREAFEALHAQRRGLYEEVADIRLLWAESASGDYPVFVGHGLLDDERRAAVWPFDSATSRPFCISDDNVERLYSERLGELAGLTMMTSGEQAKTLATAEYVWSELARAGMTRADHVVALGGGVVGDLAGFCAATYQRGVPVVQVPTTLVAQVDSAYGGKTGVDLPEAKNYVGAYHQPAAVLVDPDTLARCPLAELNAGWVGGAEDGADRGRRAVARGSAAGEPLSDGMIFACARTKLAIVAEDERDRGSRQLLNLGHTVGHAIEAATGYGRYRHGEAVGLGLLAALSLSGQGELRHEVTELLESHGLPVTLTGASADAVLDAVSYDKKRTANAGDGAGAPLPPFVLVDAPGAVRAGCAVAVADVRVAVAELVSSA